MAMLKRCDMFCLSGWMIGFPLYLVFSLLLQGRQELIRSVLPDEGEVVIKAPAGCSLCIAGTERREVEVSADTDLALPPSLWSWMIREEQAVLTIEGAIKAHTLHIQVPKGVRLVVESRAGHLTLIGLKGTVVARIQSGNIVLERLAGVMDVWTGSGDLRIEDCQAMGRAQTDDGLVWCDNVSPDLIVRAGACGSIVSRVSETSRVHLGCWGADLMIGFGRRDRFSDVKVENGTVHVHGVSAPLTMELKNGDFHIDDVNGSLSVSLDSGHGFVAVGRKGSREKKLDLKLKNASAAVFDPESTVGRIMLSLEDDRPRGVFLAFPFAQLEGRQSGRVIQFTEHSGKTSLKADMRGATLMMIKHLFLKENRRKK